MFFNSCPNNRRHKDSWEFLWRHSVNKSVQSQKKQAGKWPWSSSPPVKGRARTPFAGSLFPPLLSSMSFYQDFVSTGKVRSSRLGSKWTFSRSGLSSLLRVPHNLLVSLFFFSPHLWTRTLRNLKSSCWGGDSFLTQCGLSILFPTENCGLRLANSHPSCFTLSCKSWDQWSRQRNLSSFSHFSSSSVIFSPSKPTICFLFTPAPVPTEWSV